VKLYKQDHLRRNPAAFPWQAFNSQHTLHLPVQESLLPGRVLPRQDHSQTQTVRSEEACIALGYPYIINAAHNASCSKRGSHNASCSKRGSHRFMDHIANVCSCFVSSGPGSTWVHMACHFSNLLACLLERMSQESTSKLRLAISQGITPPCPHATSAACQ
jgi:hypothetical protein